VTISSVYTENEKALLLKAMDSISKTTCISFVKRKAIIWTLLTRKMGAIHTLDTVPAEVDIN
jgi:hypothetical protein